MFPRLVHKGIHGAQLPNALQRHYLFFATLARLRLAGARARLARPRMYAHTATHVKRSPEIEAGADACRRALLLSLLGGIIRLPCVPALATFCANFGYDSDMRAERLLGLTVVWVGRWLDGIRVGEFLFEGGGVFLEE